MKIKSTQLLLFFIIALGFLGNKAVAIQAAVTAVATDSNCPDQGVITATASGFTGAIGYQLKQGATIVRPQGGSGYQTSNVFDGLPTGTYTVVADDGTLHAESTPVTVTINYTAMSASVAPGTVGCASATTNLTVTASGGSGSYLYAITPTIETNVPPTGNFQTSSTFSGLAVGSYKFWIKDNTCASATIINTTGAVNSVAAPDASVYDVSSPSVLSLIASNYRVSIPRFVRGVLSMTAAEAASYTVEIMNGGTSVAAPVAVATSGSTYVNVPSGLTNATLTVILKNTCTGNTKTFPVTYAAGGGPEMAALASCPAPQASFRLSSSSVVTFPATITYINQDGSGNGNQTFIRTAANDGYTYVNLPPNSKFNWKVVDASGAEWTGILDFTVDLTADGALQWTSYLDNCTPGRGSIELIMRGVRNATPINYQILSAPIGSESLVGYVGTTAPGWKNDYTLVLNGQTYFPSGNYKIKFIDAGCYNGREMNVTAQGRAVAVTGVETTANCSSFNFKLAGTYDANFEQVIVSGPVGTVDLIKSNTQTYTDIPYGTYKVALRVIGASCNMFVQDFTYTAASSIDYDALNSGGFTCTPGGTGDLIIAASTTIPNATLMYSIDNGTNWQASNVFPNQPEGNYPITIKDDICGTQRVVSASVISTIQATINSQTVQSSLCVGSNAELNINAIGGTAYTWTYPDESTHTGKIQNLTNLTPAMAGDYIVVVKSASCTAAAQHVILKVRTKPTVDALTAQTACNGVVKTIAFTGTAGREYSSATISTELTTGYNWTNNNPAIGLAASGTGDISFTPTNTGNVPLVANISVVAQGGTGCAATAINFSITVNPDTKIVLSSAAGTNAQVKCIGDAITDITYAITNGTAANITGLPAGLSGNFNAGVYTISGTSTESGTFNYKINATGECLATSVTGSITINPSATIALTSALATASQTVNINNAITDVVYTAANGATSATVSGLPAGVTGNYNNGVFTIKGTPTASGTFNYTVTTVGGCGIATINGQIIVNANASIILTSVVGTDHPVICINHPVIDITYAITNGTNASITGLPAGLNGQYTLGNFEIKGSPTAAGTFNYTITVTGAGSPITATGTITVAPNAALGLTGGTASQIICIAKPIVNIAYTATDATGVTVTGLPVGVTGNYAAGVFTISGTPSGSGTFNYTITAAGDCASAIATGTITVAPNAALALTSGTASQTICIAKPIVNIAYTATDATGVTVIGLPAGVTGNYAAGVFTISGTPSGSGTFNYTVTANGGCEPATATGTITVAPNAALSLTGGTASQMICIAKPIVNIAYTATNATGATVTGLPAGVTGNYAAGVFTISGTPNVSGTFNYTVTASGACETASINGSIIVMPNVSALLTSALSTDQQSLCVNASLVNITYSIANGTNASVSGVPRGVTGSYNNGIFTIKGSPSEAGLFNYTLTATGNCTSAIIRGSITVNALPTVEVASSLGLRISKGDVATLTATGGTGYVWTGSEIQSGQNTAAVKVRPRQTTTYTVLVTNASGCTLTKNITITVTEDLKLIPNNVITPNGDGKNDTWVVKNIDYYPNIQVSIYDRAGRKVYGTSNYKNDWDGSYNGMPLAEGAYIYVIDPGKGFGLLRGTISIIRGFNSSSFSQ